MEGTGSYRPTTPLTTGNAAADTGTAAGVTKPEKSKVIVPEGWDGMVHHLRNGRAPSTDASWPQMMPHYQSELVGKPAITSLFRSARSDNDYQAVIKDNGKLLIGDAHNIPEGMFTLHALVKELPVKKIFLESDGMGLVLQNDQCMQWLRDNPHASPTETFNKMAELCLQEPTSRASQFLNSKSLLGPKATDAQKADVYRRWIEAECAVARHAIEHGISIETMFQTDDPDPTKFYNRSMNPAAWESFVDTGSGLNVFLVGESHIVAGDPNAPAMYELLKKSGGVFARMAASELDYQQKLPYGRHERFYTFPDSPAAQGPWIVKSSIPGSSAQGGDTTIGHTMAFRLYASKASASQTAGRSEQASTGQQVRVAGAESSTVASSTNVTGGASVTPAGANPANTSPASGSAQTGPRDAQPTQAETTNVSSDELLRRFRQGRPF